MKIPIGHNVGVREPREQDDLSQHLEEENVAGQQHLHLLHGVGHPVQLIGGAVNRSKPSRAEEGALNKLLLVP